MAKPAECVNETAWWLPPQMPERPRHHGHEADPQRGAYGGTCFRAACERPNAHWLNDMNGRYYCAECAREYNEMSRRRGQRPLCELVTPNENP